MRRTMWKELLGQLEGKEGAIMAIKRTVDDVQMELRANDRAGLRKRLLSP
jgi:hypothetical protein